MLPSSDQVFVALVAGHRSDGFRADELLNAVDVAVATADLGVLWMLRGDRRSSVRAAARAAFQQVCVVDVRAVAWLSDPVALPDEAVLEVAANVVAEPDAVSDALVGALVDRFETLTCSSELVSLVRTRPVTESDRRVLRVVGAAARRIAELSDVFPVGRRAASLWVANVARWLSAAPTSEPLSLSEAALWLAAHGNGTDVELPVRRRFSDEALAAFDVVADELERSPSLGSLVDRHLTCPVAAWAVSVTFTGRDPRVLLGLRSIDVQGRLVAAGLATRFAVAAGSPAAPWCTELFTGLLADVSRGGVAHVPDVVAFPVLCANPYASEEHLRQVWSFVSPQVLADSMPLLSEEQFDLCCVFLGEVFDGSSPLAAAPLGRAPVDVVRRSVAALRLSACCDADVRADRLVDLPGVGLELLALPVRDGSCPTVPALQRVLSAGLGDDPECWRRAICLASGRSGRPSLSSFCRSVRRLHDMSAWSHRVCPS